MDPNAITEIAKYDPTVLYYTYSTIAQTLAAAFAFVGAFVLFYIQSVNQTCERISDNIFETISYGPHIKRRFLAGGWGSYRSKFEEFMIKDSLREETNQYQITNKREPTEEEKSNFIRKIKEKLRESYTIGYSPIEIENLWNARCALIKEFKSLAVFIAITLVASLILLPLSATLCNCGVLFHFPLAVIVLLSIYCVIRCLIIIRKTFSAPKAATK
jgi:hypothetical protein